MPLRSDSDVSDIESATDAEGNQVPVANDGTYAAEFDGEPIDAEGTVVELDTRGKSTLDVGLSGADGADYALEASANGTDWFGPFDTFTGASQISETYWIGARYVRLRVTSPASAGSEASGFMEAS